MNRRTLLRRIAASLVATVAPSVPVPPARPRLLRFVTHEKVGITVANIGAVQRIAFTTMDRTHEKEETDAIQD